MNDTARNLHDENEHLRAENAVLIDQLQSARIENLRLKHVLARFQHHLFGKRSEKIDPNQLTLILQVEAADEAAMRVALPKYAQDTPDAEMPPKPKKKHAAQHPGRKALPAHLERERIEIHPEDLTCPCCGKELRLLGEEISEQLGCRPKRYFVRQYVRFKYACASCHDQIVRPPLPDTVIERGLAGADVVAQVLVAKYADHLPLHRQSMMYRREGVDLDKSTMCEWVDRSADLLRPIVEEIRRQVLTGVLVHADETPVLYLIPGESGSVRGFLWTYAGLRGEVFYDFTPTRAQRWPSAVLSGYQGYALVDGYAGYNEALAQPGVTYAGCWAHVRRKFREAMKTEPKYAAAAVAAIQAMYATERQAKQEGLDPEGVLALRQADTVPVLEELEQYLRALLPEVLPKSPLGEAVQYALARWPALKVFAGDGRVPIDNNSAERAMRKVAVGRKNWLFAGSEAGGKRAAIIYSLIETCSRLDIDPHAYLTDVLQRVGSHPQSRVAELTPRGWLAARAAAAEPLIDQA